MPKRTKQRQHLRRLRQLSIQKRKEQRELGPDEDDDKQVESDKHTGQGDEDAAISDGEDLEQTIEHFFSTPGERWSTMDNDNDEGLSSDPGGGMAGGRSRPPGSSGNGGIATKTETLILGAGGAEGHHQMDSEDWDQEVAIPVAQLNNLGKARVVYGNKNMKLKAVKKPPPVPAQTPRLRLRPQFPSPSFCFVCLEPTSLAGNTRPMVTEADYTCMLKDLLELPRNQSQHYLDQMGDPKMWIGLCGKCLPVIREAVRVRGEITKLELEMKTCQQQIVRKMKATELNSFNGGKKVNPYGEGRREQRLAVENILRFVYSHKYSGGRGDTKVKVPGGQVKKITPGGPAPQKVDLARPSPARNPGIKSRLLAAATSFISPRPTATTTPVPGPVRQMMKPRILQKARLRLPVGADKEDHSSVVGSLKDPAKPDMKVPFLPTAISVQQLPPTSTFIPVIPDADAGMKIIGEDLTKDPLSLDDDDIVEIPAPKIPKKTYSAPSPAPKMSPPHPTSHSAPVADKCKSKVAQVAKKIRPFPSVKPPKSSSPVKSQLVHYYGCDECEDDDTIYTSKYQLELHKYNVHWKRRHLKSKGDKAVDVPSVKDVKTPTPAPKEKDVVAISSDSSESESEEEAEVIKKTGYGCPNCPQIINVGVNRYAEHLLVHLDKPYKCSGCGELLPADEALRERHWKAEHPSVVLPSLPEPDSAQLPVKFRKLKPDPGNIWKCDGCYTGFLTEDAREYHERTCSILIKRARKQGHRSSALLDPTYICPICKFSSRNIEEWRLHRVIHHPEVDRLSCIYCDVSFTTKTPEGVEVRDEYKMRDHVKNHRTTMVRTIRAAVTSGKGSNGRVILTQAQLEEIAQPGRYEYDCPICPEVRKYDVNRYAQHLAIHQRNPYKCSICSAFLPANEDTQEQHWRDKHSSVQFPSASTCDTPPEKFTRVNLNPGEIWKCEGCSRGFVSEDARKSHEMAFCNLRQDPKLRLEFASPYSCSICRNPFRNIDEWRLHRVLHHPEVDSLCCLFCDESFAEKTVEGVEIRDEDKMLDHIRKEFKAECDGSSDAKRHGASSLGRIFEECEPCALVFKFSAETKEHFKIAHGIPNGGRIFNCPVCVESFSKKLNVRHHLNNIHFRKHQSMCDICGVSYLAQKTMTEHKFSKHGIRPEGRTIWSCPVGGCKFETLFKNIMAVHSQSVHGAPRKYPCRHCGKKFMVSEHRKEHERRHENKLKKPFQCEICGNSFAIRNYLYIHKRLSHEGRTFPSTNKKKGPPTGTKPRLEAVSEWAPQADHV